MCASVCYGLCLFFTGKGTKAAPAIRAFDRELTDTSKKALRQFRRWVLLVAAMWSGLLDHPSILRHSYNLPRMEVDRRQAQRKMPGKFKSKKRFVHCIQLDLWACVV